MPKTLQTKCKTCFVGPKSYWNTPTKTLFIKKPSSFSHLRRPPLPPLSSKRLLKKSLFFWTPSLTCGNGIVKTILISFSRNPTEKNFYQNICNPEKPTAHNFMVNTFLIPGNPTEEKFSSRNINDLKEMSRTRRRWGMRIRSNFLAVFLSPCCHDLPHSLWWDTSDSDN